MLGHGLQSDAAAQDRKTGPDCSLRTLRGAYGLVGSGVRGLGPGASESFTTVSMVDCTGGQITHIPGVPPLEDRFVIVANGREVRTIVISPATTIATANLRKR
jgi:hypothetical protein